MAKKEMEGAADVMPVDDMVEQTPKPDTPAKPDATPEEPKVYAGKYKSPAELEKAHLELQQKLSAQGAELGMTRKQLEELAAQAQAAQAQPEPAAQPESSDTVKAFEQSLKDIATAVDNGDMDPGEALKQSNLITAQMVQAKAQEQINGVLDQAKSSFEQTLAERDQQAVVDKFKEQNPEFEQMQQDGTLEKIKASNPLHDDFSAFFAAKAEAALAQGKAEQAKIQAGSADAASVAANPGTAMQTSKQKPVGEAAIKDSMLAALDGG